MESDIVSMRVRRALRLIVLLIPTLMTVCLLVSAQKIAAQTPEPPAADFNAAPLAGSAPLTMTFTNLSTDATAYVWDFGDGMTSALENPTHVYAAPGEYNVSLITSGPGGADGVTYGGYVRVNANPPAPPTARGPYYVHVFRDPASRECDDYVDAANGGVKDTGAGYWVASLRAYEWFRDSQALSGDGDPEDDDLTAKHQYLFCFTFDPEGTDQHYEFSSSYSAYGGYWIKYGAHLEVTPNRVGDADILFPFKASYLALNFDHVCLDDPDDYQSAAAVPVDKWAYDRFGYNRSGYRLDISASIDPNFCHEPEAGASYEFSIRFFGSDSNAAFPWSQGLAPCECPFSCAAANCQGWQGGPVNTQSGNYHYDQEDVSIPALGGPLTFERSYNSLLSDVDTGLGYGWTHNYAVQLFFTDELEHRPDTVIVQGCRGSRFPFHRNGDAFTPYPGVWATLTYSATTGRYTLRGVDQSAYLFDAAGKLVEIRDAQDHAFTLTYNGDALSRVADATGQRTLDFDHDAQGRITTITDNSGRMTGFGYDVNGNLTTVTTTLGTPAIWTYTYTGAHLLNEIRNPAGDLVERTTFDAQGRAVAQWTADSPHPLTIEYGAGGEAGTAVTTTDAMNRQTIEIYDARHTLISQTLPGGLTLQRGYDGDFNPTYIADAAGNPTYARYNSLGRPEYVEDALGNQTTVAYDALAQPTVITDARHAVTAYAYDGAQLTHILDVLNGETTHTYDPTTGLLLQSVNHGLTTTYAYDEFGQRTAVTDAAGLTTRYAYDSVGRLITTTAPSGQTTVNAYDAGDRLIRVTQNITTAGGPNYLGAYNLTTGYAYDLAGRTIFVTDTLGSVTYNRYDDARRLIAATNHYSPAIPAHGPGNLWNRTTQYGYDDLGRQTHVTETLGNVTFTEYNATGQIWRVWQNYHAGQPQNWQNGTYNQLTEYGYDLAGNQTCVTNTLGHVTLTEYNPLGRAIRVTANYVAAYPGHGPHNDQNLSTEYAYDAVGNQTHVTTTLGAVTLTDYDLLNRPITVTVLFNGCSAGWQRIFLPLVLRGSATTAAAPATPACRIVQQITVYNPATGRVSRTRDALGRVTVYQYDQAGRTVAVISNFQNGIFDPTHPDQDVRQETVYDPATGRVVQTIAAANVPGARRVTRHEYDAAGRPVTVTANYDPSVNGGRYDPAHPDRNRQQVTVYDPVTGWVAARLSIAETAIPTTYGYDPAGRLITTTNALSGATVTEYDILGRRIATTDVAGNRTTYGFDAAGRQITVTRNFVDGKFQPDRPDEDVLEITRYDALGRRIAQTDALGHTTVFTYDGAGRLQAQADPLGNVTTYEYDAQGNRTRVTDPDGIATTFIFDGLNRQTNVCDALNHCTYHKYDDAGQRLQTTGANGMITRCEHDGQGRLTAVVENTLPGEPSDHQTNVRTGYSYDAHGNLIKVHDALGHDTAYAYNLAGERISATDALGHITTYVYDGHGRRVHTVYPDANSPLAVTAAYNALGWPTRVDYPAAGSLSGFSVEYAYTSLGQRVAITDAAGTMTYAYDNLYRPEAIAAPTGDVQYRYNALGQRVNIIYPGGEIVTYTHDAAGRLTRVTDWENRNVDYDYTPAGRLQRIQRPNGVTSVYAYDPAGRLRRLTHTGVTGTLASYVYTLDALGNRVRAEETIGAVTRVITYTYDPLSRLTGAEYSTGESYVYQYDAVGNRTAMTTTTIQNPPSTIHYSHDPANRLTAIHQPTSTIQYTWDERGNLISDGSNTYAYDAAGRMRRAATASGTLEYTYNADGLRVRQGTDTFTWDWATSVPELLRDDDSVYLVGHDTLGWRTDTDWSYVLPDALGSVRQETNAAGAVTATREWSPYGEELGGAQDGLGYTGEWFDAGLGLTYLRARWYDDAIGQFTQEDPLFGMTQRPATQHKYMYVAANPVNNTDPRGLWPSDPYDSAGITTCEEQDAFWRQYCGVFPEQCGHYGTQVPLPSKLYPGAFYWPVSQNGQNTGEAMDKCFRNRTLSRNGQNLIHAEEGLRLNMYNDGASGGIQKGNCTICWGYLIHDDICTESCRNCNNAEECTNATCTNSERPFCGGVKKEQCEEVYAGKIKKSETTVNTEINIPLTQEQFDALVSFTYNRGQIGPGKTKRTDIPLLVNEYRFEETSRAFREYITASIKDPNTGEQITIEMPGLKTRREHESQLFNDGYYIYYQWAWFGGQYVTDTVER